jgi:formylmethanofuran dehydrogenase subunit E
MPDLNNLLERTSALHNHLCPRQVLGVRAGLLAARLFDLDMPQSDKRLFAFVETDGCFADGLSVATGRWFGRRTMRLVDYGKVAATLVDTQTGKALRIAPHRDSRDHAFLYTPYAPDPWHAQLSAYMSMPDDELLQTQPVTLSVSLQSIMSRPGLRVECSLCGEEIMNEREVWVDDRPLCRPCAGIDRYYCSDLSTNSHTHESAHISRAETYE